MRAAILAILLLSACTDHHQRADTVDINGAAAQAEANIDNYAALHAAEAARPRRPRSSH